MTDPLSRFAEIQEQMWLEECGDPLESLTSLGRAFRRAVPILVETIQQLREQLKEKNIPVAYRTPPGDKGPLFAIYGTSSIAYADKLEAKLKITQQQARAAAEQIYKRDRHPFDSTPTIDHLGETVINEWTAIIENCFAVFENSPDRD